MDAGETLILEPVPTLLPPQLPVYHSQLAPVPKLPPLTDKVTVVPRQTGLALAVIDDGAVDSEFTLIVTLAHEVVLHVPSDRT